MTAEAKIELSAYERNVLSTLGKIEKGFDSVNTSVASMDANTRRTTASGEAMFGKFGAGARNFTRDILTLGAGLLGIQSAAAMIMAEYEKYKSRMSAAAQVGADFASSVAAAARNAPEGITGATIEQMAKQAATQAGIQPTQVAAAMAPMFAAGGSGLTPQQYTGILSAAGPVSFGSQQEYAALVTSAASMMAKAGPNAGLSPEVAIGFMEKAAAGSAIESFAQYGPLAGQVIGSASAMGFDPAKAVAMFNAATKGTDDRLGMSSRTATVQFLEALAAMRRPLRMEGETDPEKLIAALQDPRNTALRNRFMGSLKGEASHRAFMRGIVVPGQLGERFTSQAFRETPSFADAAATYSGLSANIMSSQAVQTAMGVQSVDAAKQQSQLLDYRRGAYRKALEDFLAANSDWAAKDNFNMAAFDFATSAMGGSQDPLQFITAHLNQEWTKRQSQPLIRNALGMTTQLPREQTPREKQEADSIRALLNGLQEIERQFLQQRIMPPPTPNTWNTMSRNSGVQEIDAVRGIIKYAGGNEQQKAAIALAVPRAELDAAVAGGADPGDFARQRIIQALPAADPESQAVFRSMLRALERMEAFMADQARQAPQVPPVSTNGDRPVLNPAQTAPMGR